MAPRSDEASSKVRAPKLGRPVRSVGSGLSNYTLTAKQSAPTGDPDTKVPAASDQFQINNPT